MKPLDLCENLLTKERRRILKAKKYALAKGRKLQPAGCDQAINDIDAALERIRAERAAENIPIGVKLILEGIE